MEPLHIPVLVLNGRSVQQPMPKPVVAAASTKSTTVKKAIAAPAQAEDEETEFMSLADRLKLKAKPASSKVLHLRIEFCAALLVCPAHVSATSTRCIEYWSHPINLHGLKR